MTDDRLRIAHLAGPPASGEAPVAVLLHGFTQNLHCWGRFASDLAHTFTVLGVDLPGHGDSAGDAATFAEGIDLVRDCLDSIDAEVDTVVGYSMGGRMALRLAVEYPETHRRLAVIGASAGIGNPDERALRVAADSALADRLRREGPEQFLDYWLALPLFERLTEEQQCRAQRLQHWGSGVATTLELRGTGNMEPLWNSINSIASPVLVLAGEDDSKFVAIGRRLEDSIGPNAHFETIAAAGHACHLERPTETAAAIRRWHQNA